ncbi:MAG: TAXI family TRAP transporter solute-binding subunit [Synergistaceae bacterium]|nr:TAXI family TRAP transporter solute-binding subunit [Synergistaceae bacterium]MBQ9897148.1 TAXI family TRAP transporter solute-binding subunit [Synergistaceae bacterium]MBR0220790.1 TAXI family TRAP transporter solute-binding subunit [Synergistaceae bacterium]
MRKLLIILMLILALLITQASAAENINLRFMTGPAGGNWNILGEVLADAWRNAKIANVKTNVGGGVSNILNIHAKRCDIAFSVLSLFHAAIKGDGDFKGRSVDNAMLLTNLYTQYTYFIIRKDFAAKYNINNLEDIINNKIPVRFATLKPGTSTEFIIKAIFDKAYNLDYKTELRKWGGSVEYVSYQGGYELLSDKHLDMFAFSVGKSSQAVQNILSKLDVTILNISQDALNKLAQAYGTVTVKIDDNINTVGDYACLVVRKDLNQTLIYNLCKAIWSNRDEILKSVPDMQEFMDRPSVRWISELN